MYSIIKFIPAVLICFFAVACSSDEKEKQAQQPTATTTNTAETPLFPSNPAPGTTTVATGPQTIYATWVVDSVNNNLIDSNYYSNQGLPYFDFSLEKKSLSGHTGCGSINGKLKVQGDKLIFDNIVTTSKDCKTKDFEKKLVSGFKSGKTTYKISNGNLHLNIGSGLILTLRKIS
jgi:heat shock protein HslJ